MYASGPRRGNASEAWDEKPEDLGSARNRRRPLKQVLTVIAGSLVLYFVGRWVVLALASDETRIRWMIENMEEAYNEGKAGRCVAPLAKNWTHDSYDGVNRDLVFAVLAREVLGPEAKQRGERRVVVDPEGLLIEVLDEERASLTAEVDFSRLLEEEWQSRWRARVEADLEKGEDGWRIVRSRHTDLEGTQLSR